MSGFEEFNLAVEQHKGKTIFAYFTGSKDAEGKSWCPDCMQGETQIRGLLQRNGLRPRLWAGSGIEAEEGDLLPVNPGRLSCYFAVLFPSLSSSPPRVLVYRSTQIILECSPLNFHFPNMISVLQDT